MAGESHEQIEKRDAQDTKKQLRIFAVNYIIYRPFSRGIRPRLKALHVISFKYQWRIT